MKQLKRKQPCKSHIPCKPVVYTQAEIASARKVLDRLVKKTAKAEVISVYEVRSKVSIHG